jgi:hypothetical protein
MIIIVWKKYLLVKGKIFTTEKKEKMNHKEHKEHKEKKIMLFKTHPNTPGLLNHRGHREHREKNNVVVKKPHPHPKYSHVGHVVLIVYFSETRNP